MNTSLMGHEGPRQDMIAARSAYDKQLREQAAHRMALVEKAEAHRVATALKALAAENMRAHLEGLAF